MGESSTPTRERTALDGLTPRQRAVGQLLARRYTYKQIARDLSISEDRVQKHVTALRLRLGLHTLSDIAAKFQEGAENLPTGERGLPKALQAPPETVTDEAPALQQPNGQAVNFLSSSFVPEQPRIVPRLLDGRHRISVRLGIVLAVILTVLFTVIIAVAAIRSVTEIVGGSGSDRALQQKLDP